MSQQDINQPMSTIRYQFACAPVKDTPHPHSLIRVFDGQYMGSQGSNETKTLIRRCTHIPIYTMDTGSNSIGFGRPMVHDGNVEVMNTERAIAEKIRI